jgi:ribosome-associated toxin RatA of RatAB toxin-antitoxin module
MQYLEIVAQISSRSAAETYSILCDFECYPKHSQSVQKVEIKSSSEEEVISVWEVDFRGGTLCWIEREVFEPDAKIINFEQIEGDIEHFSGQWQVQEQENGCLLSFSAQFDMGIPSLSQIIDPIAASALRENITSIIQGLFGEQVVFLPVWVDTKEEVTAE